MDLCRKSTMMQSENLRQTLSAQTSQLIRQAEILKTFDLPALSWKENETSWNILECLEHLNLYGDFYLPAIESAIKNTHTTAEIEFKKGLLGDYFAKSMLPKAKLNRMKTFKDKNPLNARLDKTVIDKFISQQITLLDLLQQSGKVSLNKIKIPISISALLKLRLGDTFRFYINHMIRHLQQIENIQAAMKNSGQQPEEIAACEMK